MSIRKIKYSRPLVFQHYKLRKITSYVSSRRVCHFLKRIDGGILNLDDRVKMNSCDQGPAFTIEYDFLSIHDVFSGNKCSVKERNWDGCRCNTYITSGIQISSDR